jgi:hypothetical protein
LCPADEGEIFFAGSLEKRKNWLPLGNFYATLKIARNSEQKMRETGAAARNDGCEEKKHGAEDAGF